ncbi:single-stranded DNA-binding protein [Salmonella enterica subsp. enterica serovar Typhimurium]|nr:single-stranded DNA-binding protein [Salmonella enterica subsp. enterica serovar Typhimurium]
MAVSRLAVYLPCDSSRNGQATLWLSLVAFGEQADTLTSYRKGDLIIVSCGMRSAKRRGKDGKIIRGYLVGSDIIEPFRKTGMQEATAQA